jgi:hypothetical protein
MVAVKDVVSPFAYFLFQFFGYSVFLAAWLLIWFAIFRLALDVQRILSPFVAMPAAIVRTRDRRSTKVLIFPTPAVRRVGRG